MDEVIASAPQALSKGFYISTQPVDSRDFGDFLTVFQAQRPLKMINGYDIVNTFGSSDQLTNELRELGFDIIETEHYNSWMSVINESALTKIRPIDQDIFDFISNHFDDEYNLARSVVEEDFSVIFKEKYLAFSTSPIAQSVLQKKKSGAVLNPIEKKMYSLLKSVK